jgi:hypothetical protein
MAVVQKANADPKGPAAQHQQCQRRQQSYDVPFMSAIGPIFLHLTEPTAERGFETPAPPAAQPKDVTAPNG